MTPGMLTPIYCAVT
ncbi:hypothetical protein CGLO_02585 [Colletotrichum gloeosporioides Cg-14]|uniref:Uncharacterized protein n=1 Tax=Colletotrichum gloeosporioides (strain Cg-14) TaxID=1237896 RepID=T0KNI8_COLGC|nr:hypothetical protein CGLO_02585 [Colletotrichum gloeosporioides Cg-14]